MSHIEVHVISACTEQSELALLLRPLYRQGVLYVPSQDSIAGAGDVFNLRLALADQSLVLRAQGRRVDPFAHGLTTGGYPGFALELSKLDARGQKFIAELTRSFDGTLPFGVPTSAVGDQRILCRVQLEEPLEATAHPATPLSPVTEVADTGVSLGHLGAARAAAPGEPEEPEEPTMIVGDESLAAMMEEERTAVADENEPTNIAQVDPALLASLADAEEATTVGAPAGLRSLAPPLPARAMPLGAQPSVLAENPAELQPLIRGPEGQLAPNPSYNGMPTSILFGPGEGPDAARSVTSTDFVSNIQSLNRPLIVSTVAAVLLGLVTGYLLWGGSGAGTGTVTSPATSEASVVEKAENAPDSIESPTDELDSEAPPVPTKELDASTHDGEALAASSPCRASITTKPPGAALFYAREFMGVSPYEGAIPCDAESIDIQHPGFVATSAAIEVKDALARAVVELERPRFWVTLNSVPRKAVVRRDGDVLGRTPLQVRLPAFEASRLTIAHKGFAAQTIDVTPTKSRTTMTLRLKRR